MNSMLHIIVLEIYALCTCLW